MKSGLWLGFALWICCIVNPIVATEYTSNYNKVDLSNWNCYLCEFELLKERQIRLEMQTLSSPDSEAHFGRETGVDQKQTYPSLRFELRNNIKDDIQISNRVDNLGMQARSTESSVVKAGRWGLSFNTQNQPRNQDRSGLTPFRNQRDRLLLGPDWIPSFSTLEFDAFDELGKSVYLRRERNTLGVNGWYRLSSQLVAEIEFKKRSNEGVREIYRDDLYATTALPQPFQNDTQTYTLGLTQTGERVQTTLRVHRRNFETAKPQFEWESPFAVDNKLRRSATAPSTLTRTVQIQSRLKLDPKSNLRLNVFKSNAQQLSENPLLASTTNTFLDPSPASIDPSDISVSTRSLALAYSNQITDTLTIESSINQHQRDDHRPSIVVEPVIGDLYSPGPETIRAIDLRHREARLNLHKRLGKSTRANVGVARTFLKRTHQEINDNKTRVWWASFSKSLNPNLSVLAGYESKVRDASEFTLLTKNHPKTRRFHYAYMKLTDWNIGLNFDMTQHLSIAVGRHGQETEYPNSGIGLQQASSSDGFIRARYIKPQHFEIRIAQGWSNQNHVNDGDDWSDDALWRYESQGEFESESIHLQVFELFTPKLSFEFDWDRFDDATLDTVSTQANRATSPLARSTVTRTNLALCFQRSTKNQFKLQLVRQAAHMFDWQLDSVDPKSLPRLLSLGRDSPNYTILTTTLSWQQEW